MDLGVQIVFNFRRWIQAVFHISDGINLSANNEAGVQVKENVLKDAGENVEVDLSEGFAAEMFGSSPSHDKEVRFHLLSYRRLFKLGCVCYFVIVLAFIQF